VLEQVYELDADGLNRRFIHYEFHMGFLRTIDRGMGPIVTNTFIGSGQVTLQQTALTSTAYSYEGDETVVTRNGHSWTYTYSTDSEGNRLLQSIRDPNGNTTSYSNYDVNHNAQIVTRPGDQVWNYLFGGFGQLARVTPPIASAEVTYTYSSDYPAFPTSMTDGRGNVTRWVYDGASGDLLCEILPTTTATTCGGAAQADKISYAYTADHQLWKVTDPNGHVTTNAYFGSTLNPQKKGLLQSVTTHMGQQTSFDYNAYLQQSSMVTPQGNANGGGSAYTWTYTFDDAGRLLTESDPLTNHPLGFTTRHEYDAEGNVSVITDADNHKTYHSYKAGGILCSTGIGVPVPNCTAPSGSTFYTYDADGNLGTVRDGNGRITTLMYWENGELKSRTDPLGRTWNYGLKMYGPTSSTVIETLNSGDMVTSTFDAMDRLTKVAFTTPTAPGLDPTPTQQFAYDDNGNLCYADTGAAPVACSSTGGTKLTYDEMDRMLTAGGFSYAYDPAGNITRRTYPNGRNTSYLYDGDDRLCGINLSATQPSNCSAGAVDWDYSQFLAATSKVTKNFPDGQTIATYDKAGRLTNLVNKSGATTLTNLSTFNPALSPAGFPQTVVATNDGLATALQSETQIFTFDPTTARLTKVCYDANGACGSGSNVTGFSYSYDNAGNISQKTVHGGANPGTTSYTYDDANQLISDGTNTFTYTANGDRMAVGSTQYRYDLAHRLTQAEGTYTYTYDDLGNRATDKVGTAAPTTYAWDPNAAVAQLATTTSPSGVVSDLHYGAGLQAMRQAGLNYYYHLDQTGSVANIVKGNGVLEYSYSYQPYGAFRSNRKNDTAIPTHFNRMSFDSEYKDTGSTNLFNLRARVYDPSTGSFLTSDPIGKYPDYTFASGNPSMFSDPTGMFSWGGVLDWFNENLNPGYAFLEGCIGSEGNASAFGCGVASAGLLLAGFGGARLVAGAAEEGNIVRTFRLGSNSTSEGSSISLEQAAAAASRQGIDMRMFELAYEAPGTSGYVEAFGYISQTGAGNLVRGGSGRFLLTLQDAGLASELNAIETIAHELSHVRAILGGNVVDEVLAEQAAKMAGRYFIP
jgi:RHS repeat-associated protein